MSKIKKCRRANGEVLHIGGYIPRKVVEDFRRIADKDFRGNGTLFLEMVLTDAVNSRKDAAKSKAA